MISILDTKNMSSIQASGLDLWILISVFLLLGLGISMVYSASLMKSIAIYNDQYFILRSQILWILISVVFFVIVANINYQFYRKFSLILLGFVFLLMLLTFVPGLSHKVGKANRWIRIGFFQVQPSEFVKISLMIYLADFLDRKKSVLQNFKKGFLPPLLVTGLFIIVITLENDLGTALAILIFVLIILFVSGVSLKHMFFVGLGVFPLIVVGIVKESYRLKRIFAYLDPWSYPTTIGYNIIQAWKSFHSGGLFGIGIWQSAHKIWSLPAPHTDFVLAVVGEETGLFGVFFLIFLYGILLVRGFSITLNSSDNYGKILALGATLIILVQVLINMNVVTGLFPTTGITLPFISYGGSSLITSMFCVGILMNVHKNNLERRGRA